MHAIALSHRHLWSLDALTPGDARLLLASTRQLAAAARRGPVPRLLEGRQIAVLGGAVPDAAPVDGLAAVAAEFGARVAQVRWDETASDTSPDLRNAARLLGRLYDGLEWEGVDGEPLRRLDRDAGVPVFNHWGSVQHPLQAFADLLAVQDLAADHPDRSSCGCAAGGTQAPVLDLAALRRAAALAGVPVDEAAVQACLGSPRLAQSRELYRRCLLGAMLASAVH